METPTNKPKRKTHTSNEVKARYIKKTYKSYGVRFRKVEDADCIEAIEKEIANGSTTSEAFKKFIRQNIQKQN